MDKFDGWLDGRDAGGGDAAREFYALLRVIRPHHPSLKAPRLRLPRPLSLPFLLVIILPITLPQAEKEMPIPRANIEKARPFNIKTQRWGVQESKDFVFGG